MVMLSTEKLRKVVESSTVGDLTQLIIPPVELYVRVFSQSPVVVSLICPVSALSLSGKKGVSLSNRVKPNLIEPCAVLSYCKFGGGLTPN